MKSTLQFRHKEKKESSHLIGSMFDPPYDAEGLLIFILYLHFRQREEEREEEEGGRGGRRERREKEDEEIPGGNSFDLRPKVSSLLGGHVRLVGKVGFIEGQQIHKKNQKMIKRREEERGRGGEGEGGEGERRIRRFTVDIFWMGVESPDHWDELDAEFVKAFLEDAWIL